MNLEVIYSKIGGFTAGAYSTPPPNPPAAKFASQGDAHVRTNTQIKFMYYPLHIEHEVCTGLTIAILSMTGNSSDEKDRLNISAR